MDARVSENPFGRSISADDIVDTLGFFDSWEDRYKYIIDLGKELPAMPDELKTEDRLIRGCQSQVWLETEQNGDSFEFQADSDAFIVKGLLGVILAAYNNKSGGEILEFDIEQYFEQLDLLRHLSPTRGNGLRAMVQRIREIAGA
ncbi:MAG: Fe-S cluster assembly protein SufE [Spongiibacteraceae bacterium]|jgi:cysteine desulfuration protein SufE|nr:Fe-S cluster assembly protein SufE [Spongiibacteraceae bacterium]|tara:strand:+ start:480 stop:914 length:435 start_codon:yes stop_codon:yes gene_type:complete